MSNIASIPIANYRTTAPVPLLAPPARNSVLHWLSRVLGVDKIRCRRRHQAYHHLHQIEFGGGYLASCDLCSCVRYVRR